MVRQNIAESKDGLPARCRNTPNPVAANLKSDKYHPLPNADRRTWSQATLATVRRVFRIYLSAGTTTATAALRVVQPVVAPLRCPYQGGGVEQAVSCPGAMVVH